MSEDPTPYLGGIYPPGTEFCETDEQMRQVLSGKPIDPKGDAGAKKTPLGLIPPVAEKAMAEVLKLGAEKYGIRNWRTTRVKESTYVNAMLRHLNAFRSGEDLDPESGQSHLAHVMSGAAILLDAAANGTLERDLQLSEVKTK